MDARRNEALAEVGTEMERFAAPWPGVLVEMKDFIDLWFLAMGRKRQATALRVFISKPLVAQSKLQPHMQAFKASLANIPGCRLEIKGTEEATHRIEVEHRRYRR
jgi:hypothetical protein